MKFRLAYLGTILFPHIMPQSGKLFESEEASMSLVQRVC